jgi:hypothetical protein
MWLTAAQQSRLSRGERRSSAGCTKEHEMTLKRTLLAGIGDPSRSGPASDHRFG